MDCPVDWGRFRDLAVGDDGLRDVVTFYLSYAADQLEALAHAGRLDGAEVLLDQTAAAFERVRECLLGELGPLDVTG